MLRLFGIKFMIVLHIKIIKQYNYHSQKHIEVKYIDFLTEKSYHDHTGRSIESCSLSRAQGRCQHSHKKIPS